MTSQEPAEKARSTPDGDALPPSGTESLRTLTESGTPADASDEIDIPADDAPTGGLRTGAADAAVRGVDEVLGREVRLVTLPPASGELLSERIEQVRHLARLHHPHLLEVYDVDGLAPDTESTLVLESVPGEPLPLVLRDGPIAEPAVARMGAQLASALAHAHAHGVEHGAIGAASILVDRANSDAWLVGLTASLSGPLPIVDPEADDDGDGAARRRDADVRALAATLAEVVEHGAAVEGGDDPEAVTRPTTRDDAALTPLAALLREVDSPSPPSAALLSERLVRVARGGSARTDRGAPARLVPVVASWSESPVTAGVETPAALAAGPAVRARGEGGITPFAVVGSPAARRARRAGVLGAATATLALASGWSSGRGSRTSCARRRRRRSARPPRPRSRPHRSCHTRPARGRVRPRATTADTRAEDRSGRAGRTTPSSASRPGTRPSLPTRAPRRPTPRPRRVTRWVRPRPPRRGPDPPTRPGRATRRPPHGPRRCRRRRRPRPARPPRGPPPPGRRLPGRRPPGRRRSRRPPPGDDDPAEQQYCPQRGDLDEHRDVDGACRRLDRRRGDHRNVPTTTVPTTTTTPPSAQVLAAGR